MASIMELAGFEQLRTEEAPTTTIRVGITMEGGTLAQRQGTICIEYLQWLLENYPAFHVLKPEERFTILIHELKQDE